MTARGHGPLWLLRFWRGTNARQVLQFRRPALEGYRLEVRITWGPREGILTEYLEDIGSALRIAQNYVEPVELWLADDHLCTIDNIAGDGSMWVITPGRGHAKQRPFIEPQLRRTANPQPYRQLGTPRFQAKFCRIDGLEEIDMGDCVALSAKTPSDAEREAFRIGSPPPGANALKVLRDGQVILRRAYEAMKSPTPHLRR